MNSQDTNDSKSSGASIYESRLLSPKKDHVTPKKSSFMPMRQRLLQAQKRGSASLGNEDYGQMLKRIMMANQRNEEEARVLYDHLKDFNFFETFNDTNEQSYFDQEAFVRLCQAIRYEKHPPKKIIFKEGDPSNGKLYIIYSGEISLINKPKKQPTDMFMTQPEEKINIHVSAPATVMDLQEKKDVSKSDEKSDAGKSHNNSRQNLTPSPLLKGRRLEPRHSSSMNVIRTSRREKSSLLSASGSKRGSEQQLDNSLEASAVEHDDQPDRQLKKRLGVDLDRLRSINPRKKLLDEMGNVVPLKETVVVPQEEAPRKKGWGAVRRIMPFVARTMKGIEDLKYEKMSLREMIREYGTVDTVLKKGDFFGERAVYEKAERQATIITNTECQFLVIYKRDFYYISRNYDRKRIKLLNYIFNFIPDIENINTFVIVEEFLPLLKERTFDKGSYIMKERTHGDCFFMLYEGTCELLKTVKIDESVSRKEFFSSIEHLVRVRPVYSEELLICNLSQGAFVGEEAILGENNEYSYSVRVTSASATVLTVSKEMFFRRFTRLTQNYVKSIYHEKRKKHTKLIHYFLKHKYPEMDLQTHSVSPDRSGGGKEYDILTEQILLKPKLRAEIKRKAHHSLFQALAEKAKDTNIFNWYKTNVINTTVVDGLFNRGVREEIGAPKSENNIDKKIPKSQQELFPRPSTSRAGKETAKTFVLDNAPQSSRASFFNPPTHAKHHIRTKSMQEKIQNPVTVVEIKETEPQFDEMVDEVMVEPVQEEEGIDYITTQKQSAKNWVHEENSPRFSISDRRFEKEKAIRKRDPLKEELLTSGNGKADDSRKGEENGQISEFEAGQAKISLDLNGEFFQLDKKSQKIFEIKKSKLLGKHLLPTPNSPQGKLSVLIDKFKEKFDKKMKSGPSSRVVSPRGKTGPLLLINTQRIETTMPSSSRGTARSRASYGVLPNTARHSRKASIGNQCDINDFQTPGEDERLNSDAPLEEYLERMRPMTGLITTRRSGKSWKAKVLTEEEIMQKAKNDPNTKMLRMKFKKTLKVRMKKINGIEEPVEVLPGGVVIDYQVNGFIKSNSGKGIPRIEKYKRPPTGFLSSRAGSHEPR